jgi:hypothetical protein
MTLITRSTHQIAEIVGRVFSRMAAIVIGFALAALGLGMMVSIVLLPVGVVFFLGGILIFVGGIFAPDGRTEQQRHP